MPISADHSDGKCGGGVHKVANAVEPTAPPIAGHVGRLHLFVLFAVHKFFVPIEQRTDKTKQSVKRLERLKKGGKGDNPPKVLNASEGKSRIDENQKTHRKMNAD